MGMFDHLPDEGQKEPTGSGLFGHLPDEPAKNQNKGIVGDTMTDLKRGVEQIPGAVTGLADIVNPLTYITGTRMADKAANWAGEKTGFQPGKWQQDAAQEYSPERKASDEAISKAWDEGGAANIAKTIATNPRSALGVVGQSAPSMLVGGGAARLAMKGLSSLAGTELAALSKAAQVEGAAGDAAREAINRMATTAGAIGEGAVTAGQNMDQVSRDVDPAKAALTSLAAGAITGGIGKVSGRVANKLGLPDVETAMAGGGLQKSAMSWYKRVPSSMAQEGLLQEFPQSAQEQIWQNLAEDKPWYEGALRQGVEGAIAGGVMGGGVGVIPGGSESKKTEQEPPTQDKPAITGLLAATPNTGTPSDQVLQSEVARQNYVDAAQANADKIYADRDLYEQTMKSVFPYGVPTVTAPIAPIQERIDALNGIDQANLKGVQRDQYQKALEKAYNEPVGITHDANGREIPLTMGDLLSSQATVETTLREKRQQAVDNASMQAQARNEQVASEEQAQQPDLVPVVGPLSAAANMAIKSGAAQAAQPVAPIPETAPTVYPTGMQELAGDFGDGGTGKVVVKHSADGGFSVSSSWGKGTAKRGISESFPVGTDVNQAVAQVAEKHGGFAPSIGEKEAVQPTQSKGTTNGITPVEAVQATQEGQAQQPAGEVALSPAENTVEPITPISPEVRSYPKGRAQMMAGRMTQQGMPSEIYPHPSGDGTFAIRSAESSPVSSEAKPTQGADHGQGQKTEVLATPLPEQSGSISASVQSKPKTLPERIAEAKQKKADEKAARAAKFAEMVAKRKTVEFKDGETRQFSDVAKFLEQHVYGKETGESVPNTKFTVGELPAESIEKIKPFIEGFDSKHAKVRISGRSLKHTDEGHHSTFSRVVEKLPDIIFNQETDVIHNPNRKNSVFLVYRETPTNALVIVEIAKNGNGSDVVNIIPAKDRQLKQYDKKSDEWLDGRLNQEGQAHHPVNPRIPAEGDFSDFQPIDSSSVSTKTDEGKGDPIAAVEKNTDKGIALESRAAQSSTASTAMAIPIRQIQNVVLKFKEQFKGVAALNIRVVAAVDDIPVQFRPSPFAEGVFHDDAGLIYLVTENLLKRGGGANTERAFQVLSHEVVGHYGLAQMMGDRFKGILTTVMRVASDPSVTEDIYNPGDKGYATVEAVRLRYPEASDTDVAQEVMARMAETGTKKLDLIRAMVRQWLRDVARAMGFDIQVTNTELNDLIAKASSYMRTGKNLKSDAIPSGLVAASNKGYQSFDADMQRSFEEKIREHFKSDQPQLVKMSENTPASLQIFGWNDLPVVVDPTVLGKMHFEHGMTIPQISKLPSLLKRPMMVFGDVKNNSLVFVGEHLKEGKIVLVAMKPIKGNSSTGGVDVSMVVTGYDPTNGWSEVTKRLMRGELVYRDTAQDIPPTVKSFVSAAQKKYAQVGRELPRELLQGRAPGTYGDSSEKTQSGTRSPTVSAARSILERNYTVLGQSDLVKFENELWPEGAKFSIGKGLVESRSRIIGDSGRNYTTSQAAMFKQTGREVDHLTTLEKLKQWANKSWVQGIFDQFAPIKDLDLHAYTLTRLSKGSAGAFEAFMNHGKLSLKDGAYDADTTGGVMEKVFFPLGKETTDFLYWIAGNRAERLAGEGKENLFSPADIAAAKSLSQGKTDFDYTLPGGAVTRNRALIYMDSLKKFNEFSKNVMDMAEQSGLIDGASRKLWEQEFYVPFYRVMDESDGGVRGMNIKQGVIRQQAFKKLKGGKEGLNDLLANTLMNWAHLIDASAKNRAAKATIDAAVALKVAHPVAATMAQYAASNGSMLPPGTKKTVWYSNKGNKVEFTVDDPHLLVALNGLDYSGLSGPMMDALSATKRWLTIGVTASPFFKIRNLIRDSVQAIATSGLSYNAAGNLINGYKLTDHARQEYVSALAGGALIRFGTMLEGNEAGRTRQLIKKGAKDEHILDSESKVRQFYDKYLEPGISAYNELGNRGEEINRMSLYDQLIKQGKTHAEASLLARDLMDFSMQGSFTTIRFLTQIVPFMNARLQGMYKLGRAAKEDPAKMAIVTGGVALASLALLAAYGDDDDWKKREDWDRDNYWWLKFGGEAFRIPKPFEIGAIATVAERSAEAMFDKEMTGERFRSVLANLISNQLSMNPVPQMVKPIIDLYSNKDSFSGRPIESMSMEKIDSRYRYNAGTSMVARGASQAIGGALSPVQIDHLVRGYFSWLGATAVATADLAVRAASDEPSRPEMDYWKMATGGMVADTNGASSRYVSAMYDQAKEIEQAYGTVRQLRKEGKFDEATDFSGSNKDKLDKYRIVEATKKTAAKMNEQIRMIERSEKSPEDKREEINVIRKRQDLLARRLAPTA